MTSFSRMSIALITLLLTVYAVQLGAQQTHLAEFAPGTNYAVTVKRSHGGNDGFKDVIPQLSTQSIMIETGERASAGMPVTIVINRPRSLDDRKGTMSPSFIDWKFAFNVAAGGEFTDIKGESADGALPGDILKRMLATQLEGILFRSAYAPVPSGPQTVTILSETKNAAGLVDISYEIPQQSLSNENALATSIAGTASYDPGLKWFTRRTATEISKAYIPDDASHEGKIVTMKTVTTYETTMKKR